MQNFPCDSAPDSLQFCFLFKAVKPYQLSEKKNALGGFPFMAQGPHKNVRIYSACNHGAFVRIGLRWWSDPGLCPTMARCSWPLLHGSYSSMPSLLLSIKDLEEHHSSFFLLYPLFSFSQWSWEDKLSNEVLGAEVEEAQMYKQEVEEGDPQTGSLVTDAMTGRISSQL